MRYRERGEGKVLAGERKEEIQMGGREEEGRERSGYQRLPESEQTS